MKIEIEVFLEQGILFLYDPYEEPEVPEDVALAPVTYTSSSICLQVPPYVDGPCHIVVSEQPFAGNMEPTVSHRINTPNRYISLTDTPLNYYCNLLLKHDYADVNIWNVIGNNSEMSWIQIRNLDVF